jgi:hypothetical protein
MTKLGASETASRGRWGPKSEWRHDVRRITAETPGTSLSQKMSLVVAPAVPLITRLIQGGFLPCHRKSYICIFLMKSVDLAHLL